MKKSFFICLVVLSAFNILAENTGKNTKELDIDECYSIAERRNPDYIKAKYELKASGAELQKAAGSFGPALSLSGGYQPLYRASLISIPAGVFGPDEVSFPMGSQTYYTVRLSVTQPIFTFGKNFYGLKMAETGYKVAKIKFKKAKERLKLDVISAFYGALIAREMYEITKESLRRTKEMLDITEEKYRIGEASKLDLLMAEVELANTGPKLKEASDRKDISVDGLKMTLGMPLEEKIEIKGSPEYRKFRFTYKEVKRKFEKNSDDMRMAKAAADIGTYKKGLALSMLLPNIAVSGNLNYVSYEEELSADSSAWDNSWDVTVGLQWKFFDSFKTAADIKKASAEEEIQRINLQQAKSGLEIKLKELYSAIEKNTEIIEAAEKNINKAEESYKIAKQSYSEGLISRTDLTGAELGLMQAKIQRLNALYNYTTKLQEIKNFIR